MTDNIFEQRNRARKVAKLVDVLDAAHESAQTVRAMTDDQWQIAADTADVYSPSHKTREQVIRLFAVREQPADPFEGLDGYGLDGDAA